ncbi:putative transposase-like protein [Frankliniella fusca]|uniref:Transposase-like protein n=1 Tax=Frankliniella fusca TaxID=407009 RepID=A0AAE1I339_9NEOP|nr:putative transposase-like protein [Frankliniella fusca]
MEREFEQIGGEGKIVEIDESLFNKRKYNKGKKKMCQQWVFGGVEQGSNKCFLVKVDKRDKKTLLPLIKKHIAPGSTIYSDSWKAYDCLGENGFNHLKVNHKITFKEGDCCTNTVEGMWRHVKRMFPECNRKKGLFDSYLAEYMFRRKYASNNFFATLLSKIIVVYKPKIEDVSESEDSDTDVNNNDTE